MTISHLSHTMTEATEASTLDQDLACLACSYNLRGLRSDARCPECGLPLAETLLDAASRAQGKGGSWIDAVLARQTSEGALALLAAGALMAPVWLAPYWMLNGKGSARGILLCVCCAAFATHFVGAWKVGLPHHERGPDRSVCLALRVFVALSLAYVLLIMPAVDRQHPISLRFIWFRRELLYVLGLVIPAMQAVLWLRIARLVLRLGSRWLHILAMTVVCMWPGIVAVTQLLGPRAVISDYSGGLEVAMSLPITWLSFGQLFRPLRLRDFEGSGISVAWMLLCASMMISVIGLAVLSRRRLRELRRAEAGDEPSSAG